MKYIDADRLKEELQKRFDICKRVSEDDRNALDTQDWYRGKYTAYSECISFIDSVQQEQHTIEEDWVEKRKQECGCRKLLANGNYQCERYEGAFSPCDGRCSWIVDYQKLKELEEQEPEVDLAKEIEKYYYDNFAFISSAHTPTKDIVSDIAIHFHELGQKDAANKFDEIEYNRQRAEEEMLGKTLDEAAEEYGRKEYSHAIHFWDEGLSKNKPEVMKEDFVDSFKAGAKWMAGQGVSWEDKMTYYDGFLLYGKDERAFTMEGNFNEGDEVIVQIRKKEESK